MHMFRITIQLQSAFATPLKGDTLFGQLCWAIKNRLGEVCLTELLNGYTSGQPFAVVSDTFPQGYLPLPKLPGRFYDKIDGADRKAIKKRCWLPEQAVDGSADLISYKALCLLMTGQINQAQDYVAKANKTFGG